MSVLDLVAVSRSAGLLSLAPQLLDLRTVLLLTVQASLLSCHRFHAEKDHLDKMRNFTQSPGVFTSFRQSVVSGDFFLGYHGWENLNREYGVANISYVVRVEFDRWTYRHNRLKKTYHRYWIPGSIWVEMTEIGRNYYNKNFNHTRSKNSSVIDIWVEPTCFLRNHGISRIYRVTRSLKMHVYNIRWLAKLTFPPNLYETRELKQYGKFLSQLVGLDCAWIHPRLSESFSLLLKFERDRVAAKKFLSPQGFHNWDDLNSQYQVMSIGYLKGWNRAFLDFQSGLHCKKTSKEVALLYKKVSGVTSVYRDEYSNCRLTFRILVKFNRRYMTPASIHYYNDWSSLNYMYGVVNISYHEDYKLIAHLEFEPGLYTNHQMKAIRSEYLKLHGILFAWVEGTRPSPDTRMALKFQIHINLSNYTSWNILNTKYFSQLESIHHNRNEATIQLPEGRYSQEKIQSIYQEYQNLPGVVSVKPKPHPGSLSGNFEWKNGLSSLRVWKEVLDQNSEDPPSSRDLPNETRGWTRYTPLYHRYKNKTENSLWEDHCNFH